jgi:hypothetical protein
MRVYESLFSQLTNGIMGEKYLINIVEKENPAN